MQKIHKILQISIFLILIGPLALSAQNLRARWSLSQSHAYTGQSLILQINIQGTDSFDPPDFSVPGVDIHWEGGNPSNSRSIVSINGKTTTTVEKMFNGSWTLKAKAPGRYHIAIQEWLIQGQKVQLPSLDWRVEEAETNENYFLVQSLNQNASIPGVPLQYTLTWYIGKPARNPDFSLPFLDQADLEVRQVNPATANSNDSFPIEYKGRSFISQRSTSKFKGKDYTTLSLKLEIIPKKAGNYTFEDTQVSFEGGVRTREVQDFFGNISQEAVFQTFSAKAADLNLRVRDLPEAGKPDPFSGLLGQLKLHWEGGESSYSPGEPIRIKLYLEGVLNKPDLDLNWMVSQALQDSRYSLSPDPESALSQNENGLSQGYLLRAKQSGLLRIPALSLNYYDPILETYASTSTQPLEISIKESQNGLAAASKNQEILGLEDKTEMTGADMFPPGPGIQASFFKVLLPIFVFLSALGLILGLLGLWQHSKFKALRDQLKAWKQLFCIDFNSVANSLSPIEQGRMQLNKLIQPPKLLASYLEKKKVFELLKQEQAFWDQAFFSGQGTAIDYPERWRKFIQTLEAAL